MKIHHISPIPKQKLLDELQLSLIPLSQTLPLVLSLLSFLKQKQRPYDLPRGLGWMLAIERPLSPEEQMQHIMQMKKAVDDLSFLIKELMKSILEFTPFPHIKNALLDLHQAQKTLPSLDRELQILHVDWLNHKEELLDMPPEVHTTLLLFTQGASKMQERANDLRKAIFEEMIQKLSLN